ncbi:MAG: pilin [Patescibacteria group bacterium]|nr:pilin [Patescibacteria group bacterium]
MQNKIITFPILFISLLFGGLFLASINNASADTCTAWTPEYTAGCVAPAQGLTVGETASKNCPAGTKGTSQCKFTTDCTAIGKSCCQWKCEPIVSGSDDCSGTCVPSSQCPSGDIGKKASDPLAGNGTCSNQTYVCCATGIVTPEGEAPGSEEAAAAASSTAEESQKDKPIGAGCVEKSTGLVVPCVADGSPTKVVIGVIQRVINWLLTLSGTIFLIMFVWGGMQFIIFSNDANKAAKGRTTLVNAVIGVAIVMFSYVILDYIFGSFIGAL